MTEDTDDWQPMSTAPRDNQPIIMPFKDGRQAVVVWKEEGPPGDVVVDADGNVMPDLEPVGWKPAIGVLAVQGNA